jgi:hypothetical protein
MEALIVTLVFFGLQLCAIAGIASDIPAANQVILKTGVWTPTPEQTQKALSSIQSFLKNPDTNSDWKLGEIKKIVANAKEYRVQFVGVVRDGKRVIWCNFSPVDSKGGGSSPDWKERVIRAFDGGFWFWRIDYDANTDTCSGFSSNGYG